MDSRSLDFAQEIRQITDGRGVDIVLNSLSGQFIDAGLDSLAPGGRFIEMGVADLRTQTSRNGLHPDVTYIPFNLAPALESGDSFVRETLTAIFDQFRSGTLQPLPIETFPLEKAQDAFRYMAQARHIGRVVLCPAAGCQRPTIRSDGAYLVTGGLAGIGLAVAEWLSQRGAAKVILLGRSVPGAAAIEAVERMRAAGTLVSICQGDVSKEADVSSALKTAEQFPLRGIFHCAGVLDDGALLQQSWERFERVLSPKLEGACHLHRLTANHGSRPFRSVFVRSFNLRRGRTSESRSRQCLPRCDGAIPASPRTAGAECELGAVERDWSRSATSRGREEIEDGDSRHLHARWAASARNADGRWPRSGNRRADRMETILRKQTESQGDARRPLLRELRTLHASENHDCNRTEEKESVLAAATGIGCFSPADAFPDGSDWRTSQGHPGIGGDTGN